MDFCVFDLLQKTNENRLISSKKRFSFVFWIKSKTPKIPFEIIWPLVAVTSPCWHISTKISILHFLTLRKVVMMAKNCHRIWKKFCHLDFFFLSKDINYIIEAVDDNSSKKRNWASFSLLICTLISNLRIQGLFETLEKFQVLQALIFFSGSPPLKKSWV